MTCSLWYRLFTRMVTLGNVAHILGGGYTVGLDWVDRNIFPTFPHSSRTYSNC